MRLGSPSAVAHSQLSNGELSSNGLIGTKQAENQVESNQQHGKDQQVNGNGSKMVLSPRAQQAAGMSTSSLVDHYMHHARHPSDQNGNLNALEPKEYAQIKQEYQRRNSNDDRVESKMSSRSSSYSTQSYRDFLNSATASTATSAASSAVPSRATSGYSSQSMSEQSSRASSPSRNEEGHDGRSSHHSRYSSSSYSRLQAAPGQYIVGQDGVNSSLSQQVSSLSFCNMIQENPDSEEDQQGTLVTHANPYARVPARRPNPSHFTFCESDIMKSFLRAAERERARVEREERAQREAQQRFEAEQEYERRKQQQREAAAREMALAAHNQRQQQYHDYSYDNSDSSSLSSDESPPVRRRRRFPPAPVHFKFSSHDVHKSASKPSQRQNIGHWSTFPKSSTIMIPGEQLKNWIQAAIQQQEKEREVANRIMQQQQAAESIISNADHSKAQIVGAGVSRRLLSARRASLPLNDAVANHQSSDAVAADSTKSRRGHTRSITYSSDRFAQLPANFDKSIFGKGEHKDATALIKRETFTPITASHIRRHSSDQIQRPGLERTNSFKPTLAKGLSTNYVDLNHHRTNGVLQSRQSSYVPSGVNGYTASVPTSTHQSPVRTGVANGRLVKSTTASPNRPPPRNLVYHSQPQQYAQPPVERRGSFSNGRAGVNIGATGGESKNSSTNNSPLMSNHTLLNGADPSWQSVYEKTLQDIHSHQSSSSHPSHTKSSSNHLYKDVPSSGYGQVRSNQRAAL